MILLAINWSEVGVKAGQFILSFSIIVVLHELGHFLPAKWFKCRVEKFYLFFNPWFSLISKKVGETEYGLGWVPFGGYVKISGMIDESMDKDQLKQPPQPFEFRSKPAWQRLIIMVGGVTVNLILGFVIYAGMLWYWGDSYLPTNELKYGIATDSLAQSIGLRDGDKLLSVDGKYIEKFRAIPLQVILKDAKSFQVERNGEPVNVAIPPDFAGKLISHKALGFIDIRVPFIRVDSLEPKSEAVRIGLRIGDKILAVNNDTTYYYNDFRKSILKNRDKPINLTVLRAQDTLHMTANIPKDQGLGVYNVSLLKILQVKNLQYSIGESFPAGLKKSVETLESYWLQLKLIFSKKVNTSESLGRVISICNM
jgi:regulator of sigma E protease